MQADFNRFDTSGLTAVFRTKPAEGGLLAVFSGGRRADRFFAAWLLSGELGLPLVQAPVSVPGCVTFIDRHVPSAGTQPALGGAATISTTVNAAVAAALAATMVPAHPPAGSAVVISLDTPVQSMENGADVVVHFAAGPTLAAPQQPLTMMALGSVADAENHIDACCNFDLQIDGKSYGFSQVSPLTSLAYGPRGTIYPNVVLRRAVTLNRDLYAWRENIVGSQADVRGVIINHLSAAHDVVRSWRVEGAWPVRWTGPSFDSMASSPAMEELELCISGFDWA